MLWRAQVRGDIAMGIPVTEISIGKCYRTSLGQVRRVVNLANGKVTYESRGENASSSWSEQNSVMDRRFAQDVEREVPCGFTSGSEQQ